jgi:hypothetical protein
MGRYFVRPTDGARRGLWVDLFGADRLPIRGACSRPGRAGPVYDIAVGGLHPQALNRLAAYMAKQGRGEYGVILAGLRGEGLALDAVGCELLREDNGEAAVSQAALWD